MNGWRVVDALIVVSRFNPISFVLPRLKWIDIPVWFLTLPFLKAIRVFVVVNEDF